MMSLFSRMSYLIYLIERHVDSGSIKQLLLLYQVVEKGEEVTLQGWYICWLPDIPTVVVKRHELPCIDLTNHSRGVCNICYRLLPNKFIYETKI